MGRLIKNNWINFLVIFAASILICGGLLYYLTNFTKGAQESVKQVQIVPTKYSGTWFNQEKALVKDLGPEASFENFSAENSTFPIEESALLPEQSAPLSEPEEPPQEIIPEELPQENIPEEPQQEIIPETLPQESIFDLFKIQDLFASSFEGIIPEGPSEENFAPSFVERVLEFSDFAIPESFVNQGDVEKQIKNIQLRVSLAFDGGGPDDSLAIEYNTSELEDNWQSLEEFSLNNSNSNASNNGYWLFALPIFENWQDLENLKIRFRYRGFLPAKGSVYLDAVWLEVDYEETEKEPPKIIETQPRQIGERQNFRSDEEAAFTTEGVFPEKGFLKKIISVFEKKEITGATLINPRGEESFDGVIIKNNIIRIKKSDQKSFRPGLYKLKIKAKEGDEEIILEQDFTWGVLAINTDKSIYLPGEQIYLQMGVLNEYGHTICDAKLELTINNQILSTENGQIQYSDSCGYDNVTDKPDYFAYYQINTTGTYQMALKNLDNGFEINDTLEVQESVPFEIERIGATRINPYAANYIMTLNIKANQDFEGVAIEKLPSDFELIDTGEGVMRNNAADKEIVWKINLSLGQQTSLRYEYKAPQISPALFLLGPIRFKQNNSVLFEEFRQWHIATDATCSCDITAASKNWSDTTIWGAGCSSTYPGRDGNGDIVTIANSGSSARILTLDVNLTTYTLGSITFTAPVGDLTLSHGAGNSLTTTGNVTLNQGTGNNDDMIWAIGAQTATVGGDVTFNHSSTTDSRTAQIQLTTNGVLNINGNLVIGAGDYVNKILNISGGAGTTVSTGTGRINLKGTNTNIANGNLIAGTSGSIFNYNGSAAAQTVTMDWGGTGEYNNLYINNTHANGATLGAAITTTLVTGNITVGDGSNTVLFKNGGFNIADAGKTFLVNNGATFSMSGTSAFPTGTVTLGATSTVQYLQTGDLALSISNVTNQDYGNLDLKPADPTTYNFPATAVFDVHGNLTIGDGSNAATVSANVASTFLTVFGNLTIAAGSAFTPNGGNLFLVGGSWSNSATGTFTAGTGTVTFDAGSNGKTIDSGGDSFNNVEFFNTNGGWSISTNNLDINGDLYITSGSFTLSTFTVSVGGDWYMDAVTASLSAQTGTVTLDGASSQTFTDLSSNKCEPYNLIINKTGADANDNVTLASALTVRNTLTITDGELIQGAYTVRAEGSSAVSVGALGEWSNLSTGDLVLGGSFATAGSVSFSTNDSGCTDVSDDISISSTNATLRTWSKTAGTLNLYNITASYQADSSITCYVCTNSGSSSTWIFSGCAHTPVIGEVSLNSKTSPIVLLESSQVDIMASASITDSNGCNDISGVKAIVYHYDDFNASCSNDPNNCYDEDQFTCFADGACAGNTQPYNCYASSSMYFFADPTDAGSSFSTDSWVVSVIASDSLWDDVSSHSYNDDNETAIDVQTMNALEVTAGDPINYNDGTALNPGQDTGSNAESVTIRNTGNRGMDVMVYGTDMTGACGTIAVGNQQYASSSFTYNDYGQTLLENPGERYYNGGVSWLKPTSTTPITHDIYWGINIPSGASSGTCTGTNTFSGTTEQ